MPSPRSRKFSKRLPALAGMLMALGAVAGVGYMLIGRPVVHPVELLQPAKDGMVLYEVPRNASAAFLARDLHAKGLIAFPRIFRVFLRYSGQHKKIRAGFYYLPPRNSVLEMAHRLTSGKMATQTVTIPEGKAVWEVYGILKRHFPLDSARFDSLAHSPEFAASLGLEAPGLEGYLFPDTYVLPYRITERDALGYMAGRFLEVARELGEDSDVIRHYGRHGWVSLASIVEKEASVRKEQGLIAGVFYNRLRQGWTLGADPTVRFILRKLTGPLYASELNVNSPYNTRRYAGLPPGPICSPGIGALKASLKPLETRMMFFVAKDDGSREHYFSATNSEHNRLKEKAAQNRGLRRRMSDSISALTSSLEPASAPETKGGRRR